MNFYKLPHCYRLTMMQRMEILGKINFHQTRAEDEDVHQNIYINAHDGMNTHSHAVYTTIRRFLKYSLTSEHLQYEISGIIP